MPRFNLLIVEDNPLDAQMTCWALGRAGYVGTPVVVSDGLEALSFFRREGSFAAQPLPDLVVLDLNLRLMDGPEVLQFIRDSPELAKLKVVILSSSPEHIMRSKASQADAYLSKSSSVDVYETLGQKILDCYLGS